MDLVGEFRLDLVWEMIWRVAGDEVLSGCDIEEIRDGLLKEE